MHFWQELVQSIWLPGVNRALMLAIHATYACLFLTILAMFWLLHSPTLLAMLILSVVLYITLLWYPSHHCSNTHETPNCRFIKEADLTGTAEVHSHIRRSPRKAAKLS